MQSEAPRSFACSNLLSFISIAKIRDAPAIFAAWITLRPIAPIPKTATV